MWPLLAIASLRLVHHLPPRSAWRAQVVAPRPLNADPDIGLFYSPPWGT